jgi:MFS family permease
MVDTHGSVKIFVICEILMAILLLLLANATSIPLILVCSVILGFFTKGTIPITKIMVSESVEHHGDFEKAFGVNNAITAIAATAAPILMGFVADTYGIINAFVLMAFSVIIAIIPALLFNFTKQQKSTN